MTLLCAAFFVVYPLVADASTGSISGTVTSGEGGLAEWAEICATSTAEDEAHCTRASGAYTISGLAVGTYNVEFSEPLECGRWAWGECSELNFVKQFFKNKPTLAESELVTVSSASTTEHVDAHLVTGSLLLGTVTAAATSEAIAGIEVCAEPEQGSTEGPTNCSTTNSHGEYGINGLPPGNFVVEATPGETCVAEECKSQNYAAQYYKNKYSRSKATTVKIAEKVIKQNVKFSMMEPGKITGIVTDATTKAGIAGIEVCATAPAAIEEPSECATTSSSGEYTISGIDTDSYIVEFSPGEVCSGSTCSVPDYVTQFYNGAATVATATAVAGKVAKTKTGVNAKMVAGGDIKGMVTSAATSASLANIDVCAWASATAEKPSACANTNASGEYDILGLPAGSFAVEFSDEETCQEAACESLGYHTQFYNKQTSLASANYVTVTSGKATASINAALEK